MAILHSIKISHFRGIKEFSQAFKDGLICIIGRGDSGKSTLLEAISYVLSPNWNLIFYDSDFYQCNTEIPIIIEATLTNIPNELLKDSKFGLHIRGINNQNEIEDEIEDECKPALTIRLQVDANLEPIWNVINSKQEPVIISANDRARLNAYVITDYSDRHFSLAKGNPLYTVIKRTAQGQLDQQGNVILNVLREVKDKIDNGFDRFSDINKHIKNTAADLGIELSSIKTALDFKDITIKDNRVCLHENDIPIRLKGKGSKRLISLAIQLELAKENGIIMIDEIEQGLEPDRVQHVVHKLSTYQNTQIFITTHSSNVLVELSYKNLMLMRKDVNSLLEISNELQGCLRSNPEAFFAKKVLVCEGATEIGICRALNTFRISQNKANSSYQGIRFANGTGSNMIEYCIGFKKLGYDVCLFCDSDETKTNERKNELIKNGIKIVEADEKFALENQIFNDLPWTGIKKAIELAIEINGKDKIQDSINSYQILANWSDRDDPKVRQKLGMIAKKNAWFKSIEYGEKLGDIVCNCWKEMKETTKIKQELILLSQWIDGN